MLSQLFADSDSESNSLTILCPQQEEEISVHARMKCSLQSLVTQTSTELEFITLCPFERVRAAVRCNSSAPFSASHCIYRVKNLHHANSGNGTFDSGI